MGRAEMSGAKKGEGRRNTRERRPNHPGEDKAHMVVSMECRWRVRSASVSSSMSMGKARARTLGRRSGH